MSTTRQSFTGLALNWHDSSLVSSSFGQSVRINITRDIDNAGASVCGDGNSRLGNHTRGLIAATADFQLDGAPMRSFQRGKCMNC